MMQVTFAKKISALPRRPLRLCGYFQSKMLSLKAGSPQSRKER